MDSATLLPLYREHIRWLVQAYERILPTAGFDAVVVHSGLPKSRTDFDDQYWPLRPTPHFQHWAPIADPDCALVFVCGKAPVLHWTQSTSFWERPQPPELCLFQDVLSVERPTSMDGVAASVRASLAGKRIAFLGESVARAEAFGGSPNPVDLVGPLDRLRSTKTGYEIACLAEANRRAAAGHEALRAAFAASDRSELDLHLAYLAATAQDDAETPYKNIVALGENAATLHHVSYRKHPRSRAAESLLVDAGATFLGYASDITRTWLKGSGATASAFRGLVEGLEASQQALCAGVRVGSGYELLHEESHRRLAQIMKDAGLAKGTIEELVAGGVTRAFYPHGLGHSLGLQCHDVGCALVKPKPENPWLRNTSTIEVGQVFTIEPGLYFIDSLMAGLRAEPAGALVDWKAVEAVAPLGGIRIEDDLHVEGAGAVANLTRPHLPVGGAQLS